MFTNKVMINTAIILFSAITILSFTLAFQADFISKQKKYERVRTAFKEKQNYLAKKLKEYKITLNNLNILLVAYKDSDLLDIYAKTKQETTYKKILSYPICARSGKLGPKRKEGDGQVPEGFYNINKFNPVSNFYLSLGINYPNLSDKIKSDASNLGGDIFIHGSCVTIGCLPMTDNFIKEIYLLAAHAKNNGQTNIPVYIFPFKMTEENIVNYKSKFKDDKELILFWDNLKVGYDKFISNLKELEVKVTDDGNYMYGK